MGEVRLAGAPQMNALILMIRSRAPAFVNFTVLFIEHPLIVVNGTKDPAPRQAGGRQPLVDAYKPKPRLTENARGRTQRCLITGKLGLVYSREFFATISFSWPSCGILCRLKRRGKISGTLSAACRSPVYCVIRRLEWRGMREVAHLARRWAGSRGIAPQRRFLDTGQERTSIPGLRRTRKC